MVDYSHNDEIKMGSERSFGLVFFGFFVIVALFPVLSGGAPRLWAGAVALAISRWSRAVDS